jgi:FdhE protein
MPVLACTYCATTDHDALGTLVVDDKTARWAVDVCQVCSGYLKSFTTLQPTPFARSW